MQSDMVCRAVFATLVAIFSRQEKNDGKHLFSVIYPQHPTLAYICARSMYRPRVEDAAQAVTSYIKTDRRTLLITCGFGAIALVFCAAFLGDIRGSRTGYAQGFAEGQQEAKQRDALAEWAVSSPSGHMAYEMDRAGQIQAFGMCKIEGYKIRTDQKGTWCVSVSGDGLMWPVVRP